MSAYAENSVSSTTSSPFSFLNFGCIITNFIIKGKDGKERDVILGFEDVKDYFEWES